MGYEPTPRLVDANRLQGRDISPYAPAHNQELTWDSALSQWIPDEQDAGGGGGGAASWGVISGTLSNQTDLQAALDAKVTGSGTSSGTNTGDQDLSGYVDIGLVAGLAIALG